MIKPADSPTGQQVPVSPTPLRPSTGRNDSSDILTLEGTHYSIAPRFVPGGTASAPVSPSGSKGNVSFSPRITFHETWPSGEYDRRGEVATCNRLTPALAQQIKEELNTFKMVCCQGTWTNSLGMVLTICAGNGCACRVQDLYAFLLMSFRGVPESVTFKDIVLMQRSKVFEDSHLHLCAWLFINLDFSFLART